MSALRPQRAQRIFDTMEFVYGPLLISVGYAAFLALADQSHEVMQALADHVVQIYVNLAEDGFAQTELGAFIVLTSGTVALVVTTGFFVTRDRWTGALTPWLQFGAGAGWSAIITVSIWLLDSRTLREELLGIGSLPAFLRRAESADLVAFSVGFFAFVPMALWWSMKWCLMARDHSNGGNGQADPGPIDIDGAWKPHEPFDLFLLDWVGRLPLIGAAVGLWAAVRSSETSGAQETWLLVGVAVCVLAAAGTLRFLPGTGLFRSLRDRVRKAIWYLAGLTAGFVAFVVFSPVFSLNAGPVTVVSLFVIMAALGLAGLTVLSERCCRGFPLVVVPLVLSVAVAGRTGALMLAGMVFLGIVAWWRYCKTPPTPRGLILSGSAVLGLAALAWWSAAHPHCTSLAGCNIIWGKEARHPEPQLGTVLTAYETWHAKGVEGQKSWIVAAQGGGLFAAKHTGHMLAAMADLEPGFNDRIFAVSSVSGGSIGAAVFWAIRKSGLCDGIPTGPTNTCHRDAVAAVLEQDFLSPVLSGLLFRDFADTILPYSALSRRSWERGDTFYRSLNDALNAHFAAQPIAGSWTEAHAAAAQDLLMTPISDSVDDARPLPHLFINATDAHTGTRLVFSPVHRFTDPNAERGKGELDESTGDSDHRFRTWVQITGPEGERRDLTVGEAAVLSARFPVVTPPGRYKEYKAGEAATKDVKQVVDGGYFDNTGIETVNDIFIALRTDMERQARVPLVLNALFSDMMQMSTGEGTGLARSREAVETETVLPEIVVISTRVVSEPPERKTRGTLGAPANAFNAAAGARRVTTFDRFCAMWDTPLVKGVTTRASTIDTRPDDDGNQPHNFTLSWLLTRSTHKEIEEQLVEDLSDEISSQFQTRTAEKRVRLEPMCVNP